MKNIIKYSLFFFVLGCGVTDEDLEVKNPTAATLVFPLENSECLEGTDITTTESSVRFEWTPGANTDRYRLSLKNLNSRIVRYYNISTISSKLIKLKRGTPYSWYVESESNATSNVAKSEVWKFYNADVGTESYVPFPAELEIPVFGAVIEEGTVTLDWSGSDIDGDIDSYDVFFGETNPPVKIETDVEESILNTISVVSGKTYYWKIVTKDESGNSSSSDVFKFNVR